MKTTHTHHHRHVEDHPHAYGHRVTVEHAHEHDHSDARYASYGDGAHHRAHRHTPAEIADLRRQAAR